MYFCINIFVIVFTHYKFQNKSFYVHDQNAFNKARPNFHNLKHTESQNKYDLKCIVTGPSTSNTYLGPAMSIKALVLLVLSAAHR